jgi:diguanylate cyclase (GGDEF)-like protein/PAS domain S-box-containing protein
MKDEKLANDIVPIMEGALQECEAKFRTLIEYIPGVSIQGYGVDGIVKYWNKASEIIYGYSAEEAVGKPLADLIIPPVIKPVFQSCLELGAQANTSGELFPAGEVELLTKDGTLITVYSIHTVVVNEGREPVMFCIDVDLSDRLEAESKLRESEYRYRSLFESANDAILLIDSRTILDCNVQALNLFGCEREQLIGSSVDPFIPPTQADGRATTEMMKDKINKSHHGKIAVFEINLNRYDGTTIVAEVSLNYISIHGKEMIQAIVRDITERKEMEEWLRYISMHDKPTGLYNRTYFEEELHRMQTGRFDPVGIVICDVDGLKLVNDNLGHDTGDTLIYTAAQMLLQCFRDSDVVARIGGDEFAVILPNCPPLMVETACNRIREITSNYRASSPPFPLSISVGWAVKNDSSKSMQDIFKEADNNMYNEKPKNREMFRVLFDEMLSEIKP